MLRALSLSSTLKPPCEMPFIKADNLDGRLFWCQAVARLVGQTGRMLLHLPPDSLLDVLLLLHNPCDILRAGESAKVPPARHPPTHTRHVRLNCAQPPAHPCGTQALHEAVRDDHLWKLMCQQRYSRQSLLPSTYVMPVACGWRVRFIAAYRNGMDQLSTAQLGRTARALSDERLSCTRDLHVTQASGRPSQAPGPLPHAPPRGLTPA